MKGPTPTTPAGVLQRDHPDPKRSEEGWLCPRSIDPVSTTPGVTRLRVPLPRQWAGVTPVNTVRSRLQDPDR